MAEHFGRKRLKLTADGIPHGCMGGLLHFLDFNQRLQIKKMLTYKKSSEGKRAQRTRSPKTKEEVSNSEGSQSEDKDPNAPTEDQGSVTRSNSGKVLMRSLNSNRRPSEDDGSSKSSSLTARLLRTVSIHHLSSDDFIDDEELSEENPVDNRENLSLLPETSDGHSVKTNPNGLPDDLKEKHSLLRKKLHNAREAISKQKEKDAKEFEGGVTSQRSKEISDIMVLIENNRESLLKILKDPGSIADSSAGKGLGKSGSFSGRQNNEYTKVHKHKPQKSKFLTRGTEDLHDETTFEDNSETSYKISCPEPISSTSDQKDKKGKQWDERTPSARFKVIKKRIKDVIKDNRKERFRISMDGVLDKIPYGGKVSKKGKQGQLERPATTKYDRDNSRSIKRCHSLTESLDKYSRLIDSISSREELKRTPESLKLRQEDSGGLIGGKPSKTLGRIFSLPDFDSSPLRKTVQYYEALNTPEADIFVKSATSKEIGGVFDHSKSFTVVDGTYSPLHEELDRNEVDERDEFAKLSQIFDLESYNPVEFFDSENFDRLQVTSELDDYCNFLNVQVDPKDEAQFNYVRDILQYSGFGDDEFLRAWYSPDQPVDPLLFQEAEGISEEPEMFLEHQLLFDLINEALLEIYDTSMTCCPWLLRFDIRTRPMPSGHHVLEEAWARVSWYLNTEPQMDQVLARDFAKSDGWMELQYDCEDVGMEVDDLIMEELLDEVVGELVDSESGFF